MKKKISDFDENLIKAIMKVKPTADMPKYPKRKPAKKKTAK